MLTEKDVPSAVVSEHSVGDAWIVQLDRRSYCA